MEKIEDIEKNHKKLQEYVNCFCEKIDINETKIDIIDAEQN